MGVRKYSAHGRTLWRLDETVTMPSGDVVRLEAEDTKTNKARTIYLTGRALEALRMQPRQLKSEYVFTNPSTMRPYVCIKKSFGSLCRLLGLRDVWFHDLRRSFVTRARRLGVPESVVMKMSGHRTRAVFDRYNIVSEDDLKEAVSRIEAGCPENLRQSYGKVGFPAREKKRPFRKYRKGQEKK